ncbi:MAG TPA: redoxin domain-containing protein [Candidatus Sulfotelmatobacter sp.]|jgi:peroxiredoxin|nr:redoxin domain-containing protein [Candidatus Sulfotelmatobacter sp.]
MKKTFALLAALMLATSLFAVEIGKPAPDFTGTDITGKTIKLSDYKGKIVVIESYNSDCPFCHNQYGGATQDLQKELTAKGVVWLLVNSVNPKNDSHRTPEQAQKEWKDLGINATAWIDDSSGAIGHLYEMKTTPHCFVVSKEGTLVYAGAMDDHPDPFHDPKTARNYVKESVNDLIDGKPIEVSQTKSYGCAVHY